MDKISQPAVQSKPNNLHLEWTEPSPPDDTCPYDYVISNTPLGTFRIEWKSWKRYDTFDVSFNGDYIGTGFNLEEAKEISLRYLNKYLDEIIEYANKSM